MYPERRNLCGRKNCAFSRNITTCAELICATIRPYAIGSCARENICGIYFVQWPCDRTKFSPTQISSFKGIFPVQ